MQKPLRLFLDFEHNFWKKDVHTEKRERLPCKNRIGCLQVPEVLTVLTL